MSLKVEHTSSSGFHAVSCLSPCEEAAAFWYRNYWSIHAFLCTFIVMGWILTISSAKSFPFHELFTLRKHHKNQKLHMLISRVTLDQIQNSRTKANIWLTAFEWITPSLITVFGIFPVPSWISQTSLSGKCARGSKRGIINTTLVACLLRFLLSYEKCTEVVPK